MWSWLTFECQQLNPVHVHSPQQTEQHSIILCTLAVTSALGKDFSLCVSYSQPAGDKKHCICFHILKVRNFELFHSFHCMKIAPATLLKTIRQSSWYSWKHLRQRAQEKIRIIPTKHKKTTFLFWEWSNTGRDCPERWCRLHPWRCIYSKPDWTQTWVTCSSWPCFDQAGWTQKSPEEPFNFSWTVILSKSWILHIPRTKTTHTMLILYCTLFGCNSSKLFNHHATSCQQHVTITKKEDWCI